MDHNYYAVLVCDLCGTTEKSSVCERECCLYEPCENCGHQGP